MRLLNALLLQESKRPRRASPWKSSVRSRTASDARLRDASRSRPRPCTGGSRISAAFVHRRIPDLGRRQRSRTSRSGRLPACPRILTRKIISSTFMEVDRTEKMRGRKKILPPFENLRKGLWGLPFPRPLSSSSAPTWV